MANSALIMRPNIGIQILFILAVVLGFIDSALSKEPINNKKKIMASSSGTPTQLRREPNIADELEMIKCAIDKGIEWLLNQSYFEVGTLWILDELCQNINDKRLKQLYQRELNTARYKQSFKYYLKLFDEKVVVEKIPESRAISTSDLFIIEDWLIAAVNCKDFAPSEEILRQLFDSGYSGYLATHQLLAIMWLKEQGYQNGRIEPKIKEVIESIVSEQVTENEFSDLFAERITLILYAGYGEKIERRWIKTILDAQKEDGRWISPQPEIDAYISELHTTILAIWALIQYEEIRSFFRFPERAEI